MRQKSCPKWVLITLFLIFVISAATMPLEESRPGQEYTAFLLSEHPYSSTGLKGNLEIASVDGGGALVMNQLRLDIDLGNNFFGLYGKFPFAGRKFDVGSSVTAITTSAT
ncbi:MAG: hypothetical protein R3B51_03540 [Thermodesulfobacteriota bacterium]